MNQQELSKLCHDMSLEEKLGQLLQLEGFFFQEGGVMTGPEQRMGLEENEKEMCGSVLNVWGANNVKRIQDIIMAAQPHHIPALFMLDVIHGFRTIAPAPIAQGCTFDPKMIYEGARVAAKESAVSGVHVTFAPMADLSRDARWGRVMESTGEDKYLNSMCTRAMVKGFQGENLADPYSVGACVKHFAAYGLPEGGRDYNTVELSNRTLFEDYLPAYQAGIEAGACSVMTSFNTLDRIPSSVNEWLMRDVLRDKMGFNGVLISDYNAIGEAMKHGIAEDAKEAGKLAMKAGVDIEMMSHCYGSSIKELIAEGEIDEELVDEAVMRILTLKNELGLFENPYKDASEAEEIAYILCKKHRDTMRKLSEESFVLLENDGILPLKAKGQKIAFIGPYTKKQDLHSVWSIIADEKDSKSLADVVPKMFGGNKYTFESGCNTVEVDTVFNGFNSTVAYEYDTKEAEEAAIINAVESAKKADVVVMPLGEHRLQTGEAASYGELKLPEKQLELLNRVYEVNHNIVVVLFNGRPLDLRSVKSKAKAILEVWLPGTEGASAIANTLFGKNNPSGHLSMSFPYSVGQVPVHYDSFSTGRPKGEESSNVKFCSRYIDLPNTPLYPFGHGLSYTKFKYGEVSLDKDTLTMTESDVIEVSVPVTNCGEVDGTEVVQMYIQDVKGSVVRPVRELKAFERVELKAGETKIVRFAITEPMLRFYDIRMNYTSEAGMFKVFVGGDSTCEMEIKFWLNR